MAHEEYIDQVLLELLGELGEDERRALEAHLSTCADCAAEAKAWRDSFNSLAHTVVPVAPPSQIKAQLLERVAAMKADAGAQSGARDADHAPANVVPFAVRPAQEKSLRSGRSSAWITIAAALVIAALLIALIYLWSRNQALRAELTTAYGRLSQVQGELEQVREERIILTASASRLRVLDGTPVAPRASALLSYDRQTGRALLYANNLPAAPAGKAYQLWFIADGKPLSAGVFRVDSDGRATLRSQVPPQGLNAQLFAVTLENETGSPTPTGDKYLLSAPS